MDRLRGMSTGHRHSVMLNGIPAGPQPNIKERNMPPLPAAPTLRQQEQQQQQQLVQQQELQKQAEEKKEKRRSRRFSLQSLKGLILDTSTPPPVPTAPTPTASPTPGPAPGNPQPPPLNTKISPVQGPKTAPAGAGATREDDDEIEDIIAMSPVTSVGLQKFRRSRSSLVLHSTTNSTSQVNLQALSTLTENQSPQTYQPTRQRSRSRTDSSEARSSQHGERKEHAHSHSHSIPHQNGERAAQQAERSERRNSHQNLERAAQQAEKRERRGSKQYFGQNVSQFDLIANNIENAFSSMR